MSTQYLARAAPVLQHFGFDNSMIPKELFEQADRGAYEGGRIRDYFVIGTRFGNASANILPANKEDFESFLQNFSPLSWAGFTSDDFDKVRSSGKLFFSKWDENSPLLLFDKSCRFVYHTAGRDFWEPLPRDIRVATQDIEVHTLGELMDALYGPNAYMEAAEGVQQGEYKIDPTYFPSLWLKFGGFPKKESQAGVSSQQNQENYQRTFNIDTLLFALKNYGYETELRQPDITIVATEKQLHGEDRRHYIFYIDQKKGQTSVTGEILPTAEPTFDPSEESDGEFLRRGLDDIIEEHDLQERL